MGGCILFSALRLLKTDAGYVFSALVEKKEKKSCLFPIPERTNHILFRVVEFICNFGHAGGQTCIHNPQQIQVNLNLCIICVLHILINKRIGDNRCVRIVIPVKYKLPHIILPCIIMLPSKNEKAAAAGKSCNFVVRTSITHSF